MPYHLLSRLLIAVPSSFSPAPVARRLIVGNLMGRHKIYLVAGLRKEDSEQVALL